MSGRKALGRGLDALIPTEKPGAGAGDDRVLVVPIERVIPNPRQPRTVMDEENLQELSDSIRERGVIEPLIVRSLSNGTFELVAGERRLRASARAGMSSVPVLVRDLGERASLEIALIENIQREDLNAVDEAKAYHRLVEEFGRTHAEISKAVGKNRSTVTNLLRLLNLPDQVLSEVSRGTLSAGHARALLKLESAEEQIQLAMRVVEEGWSVRDIENHLSDPIAAPTTPEESNAEPRVASAPNVKKSRDPQVVRVEEAIRQTLGTEVRLDHGANGGKLEIRYFSDEELERLLEQMGVEVH